MTWQLRLAALGCAERTWDVAMPLTCADVDSRLAQIQNMVPSLLKDHSAFPRLFEDQVELLLAQIPQTDHDYALIQLEAFIERSGYNG